jgi:hypothetical protein
MRSSLACAVELVTLVSIGTALAQPKDVPYRKMAPIEQYLISDRQAEIALARSAAPSSISGGATVMVLTAHGYETAVKGTNGFVCLVDRSWQSPLDDPEFWNPKIRSPVCLNPQAARSVLPLQQKVTELVMAGSSRPDIIARLKLIVHKSDYSPETGAMSYMMSKEQHLNDRDAHWHPHVMFYLPGMIDAAALGANLPSAAVFGGPQDLPGGGRMPVGIFFVPVDKWSDGTSAAVHDHKP